MRYSIIIDSDKAKRAALAIELGCELAEVESGRFDPNLFDAEGGEYLVLDDDEANAAWEDSLDSYIDDCILPELPEIAQRYFDCDAFKRDARHDGRGHSLSGYDGVELELNGDFYGYRVN